MQDYKSSQVFYSRKAKKKSNLEGTNETKTGGGGCFRDGSSRGLVTGPFGRIVLQDKKLIRETPHSKKEKHTLLGRAEERAPLRAGTGRRSEEGTAGVQTPHSNKGDLFGYQHLPGR